MGLRGPRKKLPELERLDGNPTQRPIEPVGIEAQGTPFIPEHLSDDATGCVQVILGSMPDRVYSAADTYLLAAYGAAWAAHKMAAHQMASPGFKPMIKGSTGQVVRNPWFDVLNAQAQAMASIGDRLGLDPKSRAALKLPSAKQQKSKFEGLIAIQGGRKG